MIQFRSLMIAGALAGSVALGACGNKAGGGEDSCESIGQHFVKLARAEAERLAADHPEKEAATSQLAVLSKAQTQVVAECREEKWSAEVRTCFLEAESAAQFRDKCKALIDGADTAGGAEPATGDKGQGAEEAGGTKAVKPVEGGSPATGDSKSSD